jgi:hypothetical protein
LGFATRNPTYDFSTFQEFCPSISIVGLTTGSVFISSIGLYVAVFFYSHIYRITRPPDVSSGFEQAFGLNWENRISAEQKNHFLPRRTIIKLPTVPIPRMEQDISFATIPNTNRKLLCDVWQPPTTITWAMKSLLCMGLSGRNCPPLKTESIPNPKGWERP